MTTAYERALATSAGKPTTTTDLVHPLVNDPFEAIKTEIEDLFSEAKNFADGEPISTPEMAEAMTALYNSLHDAGKRADELRVAEKKPLDDEIKIIQERFNPLIQEKRGKVALGKSALSDLLTAWRTKVAAEKAEAARLARIEADRIAEEAQTAIRASSGNLEARERAEELLADAKDANKWAKRIDRAASTGTGLRTVWVATVDDPGSALDWAYEKHQQAFIDLVQSLADTAVRAGARSIPGFSIAETKVAN